MLRIFSKLLNIQGNHVELELDEDLDILKLQKFSNDKQPVVELGIDDGRLITRNQQKKLYAMFNDIAEWSGYQPAESLIVFQYLFLNKEEVKKYFKYELMMKQGIDYFSLSNCSVSLANEFLTFVIDKCFEEKIPFRTAGWDSIPSDYPHMMQAFKQHECVICRNEGQIAHYDAVGVGNNRNTDTRSHYFMSLCYEHHQEQHNTGILTFCNYYHLKPVKFTAEQYQALRIRKLIAYDEEINIAS